MDKGDSLRLVLGNEHHNRDHGQMDIESFVEEEGRAEKIKAVREKIDALGIEYLYLQFVSVTGKIMGKGIPADHWESVAKKGFQLVYGATVNLFTNRAGDYLGYGPEAAELVALGGKYLAFLEGSTPLFSLF